MLKVMVTLLFLVSTCAAQASSEGSFVVRYNKKPHFSFTSAQMHEAETLYRNTCAIVQRDFRSSSELHPRFVVVLGTEQDELYAVHGKTEIRLRNWNPSRFTQGVVILAFREMLTADAIQQLAKRAVQYSNATVDVTVLNPTH